MKILIDENIPKMTVEALIGQGFEVVDSAEPMSRESGMKNFGEKRKTIRRF